MLPILCYHKVGPISEEGRRLNVETMTLAAHVRYFARRGFRFLRAGELAEGFPARSVCFTFDDAYISALLHAIPVLDAVGGTGSFYAVPSLVGQSSRWDNESARPLAPWDVLVEAQQAGFEIGNHTDSHADLARLDLDAQVAEIERADDALLAHGIAPGSLCYPYGRINGDTIEACRRAQYKVGLALGKRMAVPEDDRRRLPRIVVAYSDSVAKLIYKMHLRPKLPGSGAKPKKPK
jgi:peptidoglycan/xylan/chitin deacetylase (PgdA/CDA1 family)